jgi:hypothetical protein
MRARNIKPALFKNEVLGTADPLYTILFEGLWCMADREGRLEDRPARIKAEVFPYRAIDVEALLKWLADANFVDRYIQNGAKVIQVVEFLRHQHPHRNEAPSELPSKKQKVKRSKTSTIGRSASAIGGSTPADSLLRIPSSLIPDPLNLIPDSGSPLTARPPPAPVRQIRNGGKTILKNGSGEKPVEGGQRSHDEPRPASEIAMRSLRSRGLA